MGYDEGLVERLRKLLVRREGVSEKKMFGGVAFLLDGKMMAASRCWRASSSWPHRRWRSASTANRRWDPASHEAETTSAG